MFRKMALAAGFLAALAGAALAAGYFQFPPAGGTAFPGTIPLTGQELIPADTQLPQGLNPATEVISVSQLLTAAALAQAQAQTATNTTAFTVTALQSVPQNTFIKTLNLTGTLGAGANITTLTAAQIITAAGTQNVAAAVPTPYIWTITNNSSANFAWTLVGGVGVTISGTATIAQFATGVFSVAAGPAGTIVITRVS